MEARAAERTRHGFRHHVDEGRRVDVDRAFGRAARRELREPLEITNVLACREAAGSLASSHGAALARIAVEVTSLWSRNSAHVARDDGDAPCRYAACIARSGVRTGCGGSPIGGRSLGDGWPGDGGAGGSRMGSGWGFGSFGGTVGGWTGGSSTGAGVSGISRGAAARVDGLNRPSPAGGRGRSSPAAGS